MKSNSVITHTVVGQVITFTVVGVGNLKFDIGNASSDCGSRAMVHGFIQRISDAAAISRDPNTGKPATAHAKFDAMQRLVEHYESGTSEWSRVRTGGEGAIRGQLFRALTLIYPERTPEQLRAWMDKQSKEQLAAVRRSQKVRDAIATFTDSSEGDAILAELE